MRFSAGAGPSALVDDGGRIRLSLLTRTLGRLAGDGELRCRPGRDGSHFPPRCETGVLAKYAQARRLGRHGAICG
jgi:dihydroxyacid dehydratase/phosphogluconate dehydratase